MAHFLRKTIGSWSGGTRVEVWNQYEGEETDISTVTVMVEGKPVIEVHKDDIVERSSGERTIGEGIGGGTQSSSTEDAKT